MVGGNIVVHNTYQCTKNEYLERVLPVPPPTPPHTPGLGRKDALNTLYLCLYGVRHMVKDHSDSKRAILFN